MQKKSGTRQAPDPNIIVGVVLFVLKLEVLDIDGFHFGHSSLDGRLGELAAGTQFADGAGFLKFSFELLEGFLNVVAVFNLYNNHSSKSPPFYKRMQRYNFFINLQINLFFSRLALIFVNNPKWR